MLGIEINRWPLSAFDPDLTESPCVCITHDYLAKGVDAVC
jgi:hypothetical protein